MAWIKRGSRKFQANRILREVWSEKDLKLARPTIPKIRINGEVVNSTIMKG